jgi:uncharacterized tellurite resistance protein B-like protein
MTALYVILAVIAVVGGFALLGAAPPKPLVHRRSPSPGSFQPLASGTEFVCRVVMRSEESPNGPVRSFGIEIKGLVNAPSDNHDTRLRISVDDISGQHPEPLRCNLERYCGPAGNFQYEQPNGRLPRRRTELADWVAVASLPVAMFSFARKGRRKLAFRVSLISCETGQSLAAAKTIMVYDNPALGYEDADVNIARTQQHGVTLALAVAVADGTVTEKELAVIRRWAADKLAESNNGELVPDDKLARQLERALHQAIKFFSTGGSIDIRALCGEVVHLVPESERIELMSLCASVAGADGETAEKELELLNRMGVWLELDRGKVRQIIEPLLPADLASFSNAEAVLGITPDMDVELVRRCLNEEYRRWNARVTNSDPAVRHRAEQMLRLVADARRRCIEEQPPPALQNLTPPRRT